MYFFYAGLRYKLCRSSKSCYTVAVQRSRLQTGGVLGRVRPAVGLYSGTSHLKGAYLYTLFNAYAAGTLRVLPYPDEALTAQNIQEGDTVALLPDGTLKKLRCI